MNRLWIAVVATVVTAQPPAHVTEYLGAHCAGCHGARNPAANLRLDAGAPVPWDKVLDKVRSGRMPPPGSPRPPSDATARVVAWIDSQRPPAEIRAGRVTARRLNRAEYANTVRDLLGVEARVAADFPLDDAGYGFDNNGDVLSVSPLLLEKYASAARRISTLAVYGPPVPAAPAKLVRYLTKKSQDDPTPRALPFSNRGALYGSFDFPAAGEYELRMRVGNYRPRTTGTPRQIALSRKNGRTAAENAELAELNRLAYPPVKMVLTVDGTPVLTEIVEGNIDYQYAHGESIARVKLTAGEHRFRASFPEFADMDDPRDNVNLDGRRKLFIDYLDIAGPFHPEPRPPASRARVFICAERTDACASRIIRGLAERAWRRPVAAAETAPLENLAAMVRRDGEPFDESIRVALQAILSSPRFLLRIEREPPGGGEYPVEPYDLASRLSYFLWSSMPDDGLLRAAAGGFAPGELDRQVRRMLADPRSDALVENFFGQWLGLRLLDRRAPDPGRFPLADDELLEGMRRETFLFAREIVREDRAILDFIDGAFTWLNGPLARYYGVSGPRGEEFQRVSLNDARRGGVITHASVLTLSSYATRTSPVLRGKWVLENLLGAPTPPPPDNIPPLDESAAAGAASLRERLEQHRANPACAVCHDQMDPVGFALENYDAAGRWRDSDGGRPVDASGKLAGGGAIHGPAGLKQMLGSRRDMFTRNMAEKLLTYALGRGPEPFDEDVIGRIAGRAAADGHRFSALVREVVNSRPFLMRSRAGQGGRSAAK